MTDLVMQSIDTLSLMDFKPMPTDELKVRCARMTKQVDFFYWWRWEAGRGALNNEYFVSKFTEVELLRFIAMMVRENEERPGAFEEYCENGSLRAALVELAIREKAA
ncbi:MULTISPECIES: hypothetical protein [unclassified Marinobacterium]|uniref:hypothetical protein n=1 Tax=unclassified Marinobacterium TaxID=2644139 RepID=UPI00156940BB|nr:MULTISPECIES: hypothetical protein [unclassified Marinobacterium]NRP11218.1 hypothetical protein [Marinobacterium sp. xm-g-48]NRP84081.1 hypothetical protein [Marinobacterium sp. xm-d-509]